MDVYFRYHLMVILSCILHPSNFPNHTICVEIPTFSNGFSPTIWFQYTNSFYKPQNNQPYHGENQFGKVGNVWRGVYAIPRRIRHFMVASFVTLDSPHHSESQSSYPVYMAHSDLLYLTHISPRLAVCSTL